MVHTIQNKKSPGGGDIMREPMQMFDVGYVTQNNRSSSLCTDVSNTMLRNLCQTDYVSSFIRYERFVKPALSVSWARSCHWYCPTKTCLGCGRIHKLLQWLPFLPCSAKQLS